MIEFFVIMNDKGEFYAIDNTAGDYPFWCKRLLSARMFLSVIDAENEIEKESCFHNFYKMSDGTIALPSMISDLKVDHNNSVRVYIRKVDYETVKSVDLPATYYPEQEDPEYKEFLRLKEKFMK